MVLTEESAPVVGSTRGLKVIEDNAAHATPWRRSSRCSASSCVEVAGLPDGSVVVRDSKQPVSAPVLVFTAQEWEAFISGVNAGEFGTLTRTNLPPELSAS